MSKIYPQKLFILPGKGRLGTKWDDAIGVEHDWE